MVHVPSSVGLSVGQKSVKNCQKRGFETKNDCTSEHQDCDQCTIVHTSIKQSLLSQEAAIKRQTISTKFKDQSHIKWNMHLSILHGLLTTHTWNFLWPKPHLFFLNFLLYTDNFFLLLEIYWTVSNCLTYQLIFKGQLIHFNFLKP